MTLREAIARTHAQGVALWKKIRGETLTERELEAQNRKRRQELAKQEANKKPPRPKPPAPKALQGIDYSSGNGLTAAEIRNAGKSFVGRYISSSDLSKPNPKDIDKVELQNLLALRIAVVLFWETSADWMLGGHEAGVINAGRAKRQVEALGIPTIPILFTADFDATPGDQVAIDACLDGAASIIGRSHTGLYGGYWPVKRAFDAGKISFACQAYAWSGGQWDPRAQLQQYQNGVRLGPAEVDLDRSTAVDFGQWPRP